MIRLFSDYFNLDVENGLRGVRVMVEKPIGRLSL